MSSKLSLLDLPPEVRIQIYKHLSPVNFYNSDYSSLRRSCRTIHSEYTYEALGFIKQFHERLASKLQVYNIEILGTPESIFRTSILQVELPQSYLSNPFRTISAALIPWKWLCLKKVVINVDSNHPYVHARLPVMQNLVQHFDDAIKRRSPSTVHRYHALAPGKQFAIEEILVQWLNWPFRLIPPPHPVRCWYLKLRSRLQRHARLWDVDFVFDRNMDRNVAMRWRRRGLVEAHCMLVGYVALIMFPGVMMATSAWTLYSRRRNELLALAKMVLLLVRLVVKLLMDYVSARYLR